MSIEYRLTKLNDTIIQNDREQSVYLFLTRRVGLKRKMLSIREQNGNS